MAHTDYEQRFDRRWQMYIDGEFRDGSTDETFPVVNPATGREFATAPVGTADDVDDAVAAARTAFESFKWSSTEERETLLNEVADAIADRADELAHLETLENGKPLSRARKDARNAERRMRYYAGAIDKFYGATVKHSPNEVGQKVYEPYGVVAVVLPWNWPLTHSFDFAAVALATGNTVVVKPAPETPLCALRAAELFGEVLPEGVFNVVTGADEAGSALTSHADVDMITFTGNDRTGEAILDAASEHITPTMMELGGKNAAIVFPDADLERAADGVVASSFGNNGESCTNSERLLVHEAVYDEFLDALRSRIESITVNDGLDDDAQVGPLVSRDHADSVHQSVDRAVNEGARLIATTEGPTDPALEDGFWFPPRAYEIEEGMAIAREEVFGPVVGVLPFSDEDDAIRIANDSEYGLAAYVWTSDLDRAHRLAAELEVGKVSVNSSSAGTFPLPHGGYKRTGFGRKNDYVEAMAEFTQTKSIYVDLTDEDLSL